MVFAFAFSLNSRREKQLRAILKMVESEEKRFEEAVAKDLGRCKMEGRFTFLDIQFMQLILVRPA